MFGIRESFSDFLKDAHTKSEDVPQKVEDLAASGIRLAISDKNDPDGVGYVQWRVAFYVAGGDASLGNFMCLLDPWWRTTHNRRLRRCVILVEFPWFLKLIVSRRSFCCPRINSSDGKAPNSLRTWRLALRSFDFRWPMRHVCCSHVRRGAYERETKADRSTCTPTAASKTSQAKMRSSSNISIGCIMTLRPRVSP